ncbi:MAG TPA: phenylacetic acid degradation operon negative regulatory protein PaaX [Steroidobacteraceae bacterium]|nr:phenylacetic acid degradation operon negative regulatory protein PaaX [Steroidobacteraceae bacterium]
MLSPARTVLRAFRTQRPIRAGSLLITIFGDAVAPRGGEIALASLIELCRPFGISERLVRTSIGRLAKDDWLGAARAGRNSFYRLTARGRNEFEVATQRIYGVSTTEWTGCWTLLLMFQLSAAERSALSEAFRWRGFGQAMPGVLAYPADRMKEVEDELANSSAGARVLCMRGSSDSPEADRTLAQRAWNLAELEQRYRRFLALFRPVARNLDHDAIAPAACFVIRTLLIHEYRRIHLRDPLLPASLLPATWPGVAASELCRELYSAVFSGAERFLTMHGANRAGPIPPASPETLRRFGGLELAAR